jgi:hypothetical protein
VILLLTASVGAVYLGNSFLSAFYLDSPFRTPVSRIIRNIFIRPGYSKRIRSFPAGESNRKAHALSWLLVQSTDGETVGATVRAIAGLAFTPSVQVELTQEQTPSILASLLSSELLKATPNAEFLDAIMHALLHLVQSKPLEKVDEHTFDPLWALVGTGGVLSSIGSFPLSVQTLAVSLKGRIIRLLFPLKGKETPCEANAELFEQDIPVLASTCADPFLRRSLIELVVPSGNGSASYPAPPRDVSAIPAVIERITAHSNIFSSNLGEGDHSFCFTAN